ncbi:MAG: nitrogen regulation protein NR(II) [Candidatus Margulisiibacteriota bacterium]
MAIRLASLIVMIGFFFGLGAGLRQLVSFEATLAGVLLVAMVWGGRWERRLRKRLERAIVPDWYDFDLAISGLQQVLFSVHHKQALLEVACQHMAEVLQVSFTQVLLLDAMPLSHSRPPKRRSFKPNPTQGAIFFIMQNRTAEAMVFLGPKDGGLPFSKKDKLFIQTASGLIERTLGQLKNIRFAEQVAQHSAYARLTRSIAHEINNPMGMVLSGMELLIKRIDDKPKVLEYATMVKNSVFRLIEITDTMLKYGGAVVKDREVFSINQLVDDICLMAEGECRKQQITLEKQTENLPEFVGDPNRLHQALVNVVLNAIEATPEGGMVKVQTTMTDFVDRKGQPKTGIEIRIADTGCGIDAVHLAKIFDPFFTTKSDNNGLGLAMVLNIIHDHHGKIEVESTPNAGTTFRIFIPSSTDPKTA